MGGIGQLPEYPRCQTPMEAGYLLEYGYGDRKAQATWVEGKPEMGWFFGLKTSNRRELLVVTYRCPSCGRLESYAHEPAP
jgi:hypothetical protein